MTISLIFCSFNKLNLATLNCNVVYRHYERPMSPDVAWASHRRQSFGRGRHSSYDAPLRQLQALTCYIFCSIVFNLELYTCLVLSGADTFCPSISLGFVAPNAEATLILTQNSILWNLGIGIPLYTNTSDNLLQVLFGLVA